ncbi:MAG: hypothetical protein SGJ27_19730, partial [Candidatus Melainabacteria bacterium]|nr:hypothetical protein [Candidatus Melainabacteria bacterium]
ILLNWVLVLQPKPYQASPGGDHQTFQLNSGQGHDDQFGKFQKKLSKELGINVDCRGDGSFELHFSDNYDPNAKDKSYDVKTVKFDKTGKVAGAEHTKHHGMGGSTTEKADTDETLKALKKRIEEKKSK